MKECVEIVHLVTSAHKRCYNAAFSLLIVLWRNSRFYTISVYLCLKCVFHHPQEDVFKGLRVVWVFVYDDRRTWWNCAFSDYFCVKNAFFIFNQRLCSLRGYKGPDFFSFILMSDEGRNSFCCK